MSTHANPAIYTLYTNVSAPKLQAVACQRPRTKKNNTATGQRAALKIQDEETKKM
jgi:hypothetical protein